MRLRSSTPACFQILWGSITQQLHIEQVHLLVQKCAYKDSLIVSVAEEPGKMQIFSVESWVFSFMAIQ